jgi:Flp pilus assembly protein TadG
MQRRLQGMHAVGSGALALLRRIGRDQSGFTAVEFSIVAMPFVLLLFGILSVCMLFFTTFSMENAVWQASRAMRTGQFQTGTGAYAGMPSLADRKNAFKQALCKKAPPFIDCNKAIVLVQSNASFSGIVEPKCAEGGTVVDQATADAGFSMGGASSVVLVTVCYPWKFGGHLPFIKLGNLQDGALLIQASVAFRTEPYQ